MYLRGLPPFWTADISAPTVPGTYHAYLSIGLRGEPTQTVELPDTLLTVVTPTSPLRSGFVYDRENNLWLTSSDGARTRKLTFYPSRESAVEPAWAPDGQQIAFVHALPVAADELPVFEIWSIRPDGSDARPLVTRRSGEDLFYPAWTADGRLLFTVERVVDPTTGGTPTTDRLQEGRQTWDVEQWDPATGKRRLLIPNALMADLSRDGTRLVYLSTPPAQSESQLIVPRALMIADADGGNPRVLVQADQFQALHAPRLAPDGQTVAFAATNPDSWDLTPISWMHSLAAPGRANGVPWDIYAVPAAGGAVQRLTHVQADLPVVAWARDSRQLAFLTETGLFLTSRDAAAPQLRAPGALHSYLGWYEP
jgi:Tol biopolymer transport system component